MKSKLALIIPICLTFLFAGVTSNNVSYADSTIDNSKNYSLVEKDGKTAIYNKLENNFIVEAYNTDGTEVNLEEYKDLLNESLNQPQANKFEGFSSPQNQSITSLNDVAMNYYTESRNYNSLGSPLKMTPDINCKNSGDNCPITKVESKTTSESFGSNVTGGDKNYIKLNASFTWTTSATVTFTYGWTIPKGKTGYLQFTPRNKVSTGTITYAGVFGGIYQVIGTKDVWGQTPVKLPTGEADGVWEIINLP